MAEDVSAAVGVNAKGQTNRVRALRHFGAVAGALDRGDGSARGLGLAEFARVRQPGIPRARRYVEMRARWPRPRSSNRVPALNLLSVPILTTVRTLNPSPRPSPRGRGGEWLNSLSRIRERSIAVVARPVGQCHLVAVGVQPRAQVGAAAVGQVADLPDSSVRRGVAVRRWFRWFRS